MTEKRIDILLILLGIGGLIYLFTQGLTLNSLGNSVFSLTAVNLCTSSEPTNTADIILNLGSNSAKYTAKNVSSCTQDIVNAGAGYYSNVSKLVGTNFSRNTYSKNFNTTNITFTAPGTNAVSCNGNNGTNYSYTCLDRVRTTLAWFSCAPTLNDSNYTYWNWSETANVASGSLCPVDSTYYWCNTGNTITVSTNESGLVSTYFDTYFSCRTENRCSANTDCTANEYCTTASLCAQLSCNDKQIAGSHVCSTVECTASSQCVRNEDRDCDGEMDSTNGNCEANVCKYPTIEECKKVNTLGTFNNEDLGFIFIGFILGGVFLNKRRKKK